MLIVERLQKITSVSLCNLVAYLLIFIKTTQQCFLIEKLRIRNHGAEHTPTFCLLFSRS